MCKSNRFDWLINIINVIVMVYYYIYQWLCKERCKQYLNIAIGNSQSNIVFL